MRWLGVVVLCSASARAQPPVRRFALTFPADPPRVRTDVGSLQVGLGGEPGAVQLGYHLTHDVTVRAREWWFGRELEIGYAFYAERRVAGARVPFAVILIAGGGASNAADPTVHAGLAVRTYPVVGVGWFAMELGARWTYEVVEDRLAPGPIATASLVWPGMRWRRPR